MKEFQRYGVHIREGVKDCHGKSPGAYIIPAWLNQLQFIAGSPCLEGDRASQFVRD